MRTIQFGNFTPERFTLFFVVVEMIGNGKRLFSN